MKNRLSLILLVLALVHYGASEPRQTNASGATGGSQKSKSKEAAISPQGFAVDQIVKFFKHKTGQELMSEKKSKNQNVSGAGGGAGYAQGVGGNAPIGTSVAELPSKAFQLYPKPVAFNTSVVKTHRVAELAAIPPPPARASSIVAIRREVQNIFNLNQRIQKLNAIQSAQIQNVQGQARVHEKILNELEGASKKQPSEQKAPNENALLAQEKLRKIHEETQSEAQIAKGLDENSHAPVPESDEASQTDNS